MIESKVLTVPGYYWWLPECSRENADNPRHWTIIQYHPDSGHGRVGVFVGPIPSPPEQNKNATPPTAPLSIPPTGPVTERDILAIIAENDKPKREYKYATFDEWLSNNDFAKQQPCPGDFEEAFNAAREIKE